MKLISRRLICAFSLFLLFVLTTTATPEEENELYELRLIVGSIEDSAHLLDKYAELDKKDKKQKKLVDRIRNGMTKRFTKLINFCNCKTSNR